MAPDQAHDLRLGGLAACLAVVVFVCGLTNTTAAHALAGGTLPRSLTPAGVMTFADGTTRTFTPAQTASIRKTLVGQASLYAQTPPPTGSYVLDPGTRAKILAGNSPDAPAVRRGTASISRGLGMRAARSLFGPVSVLVTANLAVWSHNAGYIADAMGWFRTSTPVGTVTSITMEPVTRGDNLFGNNDGSTFTVAPSDGYKLTAYTSAGSTGSEGTDYTNCAGYSGVPKDRTATMYGLPVLYSTVTKPCVNGWGPGTQRQGGAFVSADPKPETGTAPAGARVGTSPAAPASKTQAAMDADADALLGTELDADRGTALAEAVAQSGLGDSPLTVTLNVPSCTGDLYAACAAKLSAADLVPSRTTRTFTGADVEQPADAVLNLSPAGGATVQSGSTVTVDTNPAPSAMPRLVPNIADGQTYAQYLAELQSRGLVGESVILSDATLDPSKGPDAAVSTTPASSTRVEAGSTVQVRTNPSNATAPAPGAGAMPDVPAIDLSPLAAGQTCTQFPFGVPCWVVGALGGFSGSDNCPSWSFPITAFGGDDLPIDLCPMQPAVDIFRPLFGILATLGLGWLFMGAAMGFGGRGADPA